MPAPDYDLDICPECGGTGDDDAGGIHCWQCRGRGDVVVLDDDEDWWDEDDARWLG
jgi:RecJ-like exonuclease